MTKRPTGEQQKAALSGLRQQAAAWLLGIQPRTLRERSAPRNADATYDARDLVAWWLSLQAEPPEPDSDDKRRLIRAQADMAELKRDQRAGELLRRVDVQDGQRIVSACLRVAGEQLRRSFGDEAADILSDALTTADKALERAMRRAAGSDQPAHDD